MASADIQVIAVLAAWSSGSTALTGYLDHCGAFTCPPHLHTNDARTPDSYESKELRAALMRTIDEKTLRPIADAPPFAQFLQPWLEAEKRKARAAGLTHIALKHPLLSYTIPVLERVASPKYLVVTRPHSEIENTRKRRKWSAVYGQAGAKAIYNTTYSAMHARGLPYLAVPFARFRSDPGLRRELLAYVGLAPDEQALSRADSFLR